MVGIKNNKVYEKNVSIIKKYGNKHQLIYMKSCRVKGYESDELPRSNEKQNRNIYDKKLENSIARSRSMIRQYAMCNDWEYFVTLTIDRKKHDRYETEVLRDVINYINAYNNKNRNNKIKFLLIPEKHEDGAWHMHGLMANMPQLRHFKKTDFKSFNKYMQLKIPNYIRRYWNNLYIWEDYKEMFGYCMFDKIRDKEKIANYVIKYCTKNPDRNISDKEMRMYYNSRGLRKAETIVKGNAETLPDEWDFQSDYCKIKWLTELQFEFYKKEINKLNYNDIMLNRQEILRKEYKRIKMINYKFKKCQENPFMDKQANDCLKI